MLWDFSVRTDHEIAVRRPDILMIDKSEKNCYIIDVVIPEDGRVRAKEDEKVEKISSGSCERSPKDILSKGKGDTHSGRGVWNNTRLRLKENLRTIGVDTSIELIQRSVLLGSARILRKVLKM